MRLICKDKKGLLWEKQSFGYGDNEMMEVEKGGIQRESNYSF